MPFFDWDAEITDSESEILIDSFAEAIHKYGLQTPAILLLEIHRPFHFLLGSGVVAASGVLVPLFGARRVQQTARLLETRQGIERLISRLEQTEHKIAEGRQ